MTQTLARSLRDELLALLAPLASAGSPEGLRAMLQSFGHTDAMAEHAGLRSALLKHKDALLMNFALCSLMAVGGANSVVPEMHRQAVDVHL